MVVNMTPITAHCATLAALIKSLWEHRRRNVPLTSKKRVIDRTRWGSAAYAWCNTIRQHVVGSR